MISLLRVLHLLSLLNSVLSSLPAPVNLSVHSVNFHHVLRWDPGPGTPPGTRYRVFRRMNRKELKPRPETQGTSLELELSDSNWDYVLSVRATYNQTESKESKKYLFTPYSDTTIGPPKVSLAGCGNCIQVNISLPEPDSRAQVFDIQKFLGARFRVLWRKHGEEAEESDITENRSYTVNNLQVGTEYCVKVETKTSLNTNTEPSAWSCTFTSIVEPSRVPVVIGAVAALLLFAVGVLFALMCCLYHAGFICKLKGTLPRALIEALSRGYTLTPERTIPDKISIATESRARHHLAPAAPQPPTRGTNSDEEEDEDEDEEGDNVYVVRDPELSSGESSRQNSGNCGSSTEVEAKDLEDEVTPEGLHHHHHDEDEAEGAEVPLVSEDQTDVQEYVTGEEEEEEEEEDVCDSSGDINLFSVTLSALAASEEEEHKNTRDSLTDLLKLDTDSTHTLRHTHSQRGSDDETTVALLLPTHEDFTDAGYEDRHEETEEEEEEEEFSAYMRHT